MALRFALLLMFSAFSAYLYADSDANSTADTSAHSVKVEILGIEGALLKNVRDSLSIGRLDKSVSASKISQAHRQANTEIEAALQPFGYYQSRITATLDSSASAKGKRWLAQYTIAPGPAVIINKVTVNIGGEGLSLESLQTLLSENPMRRGEQLHHPTYSQYKQALYKAAYSAGYIDAQFKVAVMEVDTEANQAEIRLLLNTGPRFYFGEITIQQEAVEPRLIERLITIETGSPFTARRLLNLQLALSDTGFFGEITIDIQEDNIQNQHIPVVIVATSAKRTRYTSSVGYGTDTGPRIGFGINNRRLNKSGHSTRFNLRTSGVESAVNTQYKIPVGDFYSEHADIFVSGKRERVNDTDSEQYAVGTSLNQNRWAGRRRLSLTLLRETFSFDGEDEQVANLLIPGISYTWKRSDKSAFIRRGLGFNADIRGGLESRLSETRFLYTKLSAKSIYPLGDRSRLLKRLELGLVASDEFEQLPPSQRFFAGGSQSVRGYGYKDIGPENASNDIIGGQYLVAASVEVDRLFWGNIGGALFYNVGEAASDKNDIDLKQGVGIGFRYRSPVGMIRVDLAHPLDDDDTDVRLHVSLGPDL
ncbi:MAG: autotransporter assembly complex family protein [Pseudomonadota bacterium]